MQQKSASGWLKKISYFEIFDSFHTKCALTIIRLSKHQQGMVE
jgi:hypothetical protein